MMNFNEYQTLAARTDKPADTERVAQYADLLNAAIGMVGEAAEFLDRVKKIVYQGHSLNDNREKLIEEAGDVEWYTAKAARLLGTTLENVSVYNINKLEKRYPTGFSEERSVNRDNR